jgi:hypothetical protein
MFAVLVKDSEGYYLHDPFNMPISNRKVARGLVKTYTQDPHILEARVVKLVSEKGKTIKFTKETI